MTREEATKLLKMNDQAIWLKGLEKEQKEATEMAIKSLEAWEKVREDLQKFIDANSNSGDIYLDGRADGGWHALATIKRCLAEVENG